jgi:hypothetical protein
MEVEIGDVSDMAYEITLASLSDHESPTADEVVAVTVKLGVEGLSTVALTASVYGPYVPELNNTRT